MLHIDTGNTAFMLICASLVMLMTPGLAFFYGGLVGRKNVLAIMIQSFVSLGWTTVLWFSFGYSMCFSGNLKSGTDLFGIIGNFHLCFLNGVTLATPCPLNPTIPLAVFFAYQMMFAIITPALITGAFANRVTFKAYFLFLTAWLIFVYFPFVHMVWGGGILQQWGVLDFAGGIVVHNIAGIAALASVLYVGKRTVQDRGPHSIPLVALGHGFAVVRVVRLQRRQRSRRQRRDRHGLHQHGHRRVLRRHRLALHRVVHLQEAQVPRTPHGRRGRPGNHHAGRRLRVAPDGGLIGIIAGVVCYLAVALKNKLKWDDALDVWGVHGVGGFLGIVLLGLFATTAFNASGANGLFHGNPAFFMKELVAVLLSSVYAFVFTYAMLWIIDRFTPVKVTAGAGADGPRRGSSRRDGIPGRRVNMERARSTSRPGRLLIRAIWAGTAFAASLPFFAQALVSPAQTGPWYKQIQVDTFLSASYSYNFNRPGDHALQYRVFDIKDDQAMLDVASLTVQKAAEKPGGFGFRLDMGAGQSQPEVTAASGFFRSSRTGEAGHFDVEQAYVSYVANVGRGLRFDLGKYYAPIGYESVERYDAYNDNATHSFLFGYCGPFTTTGLKISYPFSKQWSGMVMVVQGWDNVKDNNSGKSVEAQVAYTPNDAFSLYLSCLGGPEQTDNTSNMRQAYDLCATWQAFQALSVGLNVDYGHETERPRTGQKRHVARLCRLRSLRLHRPLPARHAGGAVRRPGRREDGNAAEAPRGDPHALLQDRRPFCRPRRPTGGLVRREHLQQPRGAYRPPDHRDLQHSFRLLRRRPRDRRWCHVRGAGLAHGGEDVVGREQVSKQAGH